ncbi:short-chain dehydrogenase like protein [Zymoseptoria brevis]|uniref:Short-chain dehydrogenase like protein n=1 Tax=Zymoseptoria brevis TaxID=1047168 RepID=A0A0F4GNY4_9PEZI|nr:short-chain dehydrogenase like protein [Zymoseptoria brevis]
MTPVSILSFKLALITGGAGGLGRAMAESLIAQGKSVIIAGRTESTLKQTASEIGAKDYFVIDVSDISAIGPFVKNIIRKHPDLDCVINNAGVQRPFQILGPNYDFDLSKADQEIDTNIRAPLHMCVELVPHLNSLPNGGVIMNISSILGYNPTSLINPVYNGSKAWVAFFTTNLRSQLKQAGSKIKVVEIVPPSVETALHRERQDPDDNKRSKGNQSALTIEEFMKDVEQGWREDRDRVSAGPGKELVEKWEGTFGEAYAKAGG